MNWKLTHDLSEFLGKIEQHDLIGEVRQQGTIIALELKAEEATSYFHSIRDKAYDFFIQRRVLLRPLGNVIYVFPPYCITYDQLERTYQVIEDFLNYYSESLPPSSSSDL